MRLAATIIVVVLMLSACSDDNHPVETVVLPGAQAADEAAAAAAVAPDLGETIELANGILLRVDSIGRSSRRRGADYDLTASLENPTDEAQIAPQAHWLCSGDYPVSSYIVVWDIGKTLAPGAVFEGELLISASEGLQPCVDPAIGFTTDIEVDAAGTKSGLIEAYFLAPN